MSWVFTLEYCLCNLRAGNPSDCGRDSPPSQPAEEIYFKTMLLLFADLDFHVMSKDKFSEHNPLMKWVTSGLQTHLGLSGVDDND